MSIISDAPYYDRYDSKKQYTQLLAVPGRVAQARELTEIQSTMKDIIRSIGDSIMSDGNIVEGCQVIIDKPGKNVTVTAGKVYISGMVLPLPESNLEIDAVGTEVIGVRLKESIVHIGDDSDLADPALGFENYRQPGCDRLKSELELVKNDTSAAILATLIDGELSLEQQAPNYSALNETLARRTYDESGSYIVEGLEVRVESHETDNNKFYIAIDAGKAYVHGYELKIPSTRKIEMRRSITSNSVNISPIYNEGASYFLTTGLYVKSISKVTGYLSKVEELNIQTADGAAFTQVGVKEIEKVTSTDGSIIYPADSYFLESAGAIAYLRWRDTSGDPPGDVKVYFYYDHEFEQGVDYRLGEKNGDHYLEWIEGGTLPVNHKTINIYFEKYLARKDTVYIDQYGNISALEGIPAEYGFEIAPESPLYTLSLANIMSPPGGAIVSSTNRISVSNVGLTRFTMSDIHKMLNRIRTIEYDQTILSLNTEAKEYATDNKRGIFTDSFIDLSKIDFYFNYDPETKGPITHDRPIFDSTIDLDGNLVYLPLSTSINDALYDQVLSSINRYDRVVSLRTDNRDSNNGRVVLSQMSASDKTYQIAPYLSAPQIPEVFLNPSLDTWYEDDIITVPVSINTTEVVSESSRHLYTSTGRGTHKSVTSKVTTQSTAIGTRVNTVIEDDVISESAITYIRERDIDVTGLNYFPGLNISCYFEGIKIGLTPTGDTEAGTSSGTIKSRPDGSFTAKFRIPKGKFLTGTRLVTLEAENSPESYSGSASAFYRAVGTARSIKRTVSTITTVLLERVTTTNTNTHYYNDPLAQTFVLDNMTLLKGIDIYFNTVPAAKNIPVTCEIRGVTDGNINSTIYGFKTLMSQEVIADSTSKTATRFNFNDPVLIDANKEYAFVLKSNSKEYTVFVAELGELDKITGQPILANPYLAGVMMSSSNNSSWTVHQNTDMKFRLIADEYVNKSEIVFNNIHKDEGFCRLMLAAESIIPDGTNIDWYYSVDSGAKYSQISPYNIVVLNELKYDVTLKAVLSKSTNTQLSPIIALDSVSLSTACYDSHEGYYISKQISGLDPYQNVDIILDTYNPGSSGTSSIEVYVSPSDNNDTPYKIHRLNEVTEKSKAIDFNWWERTYRVSLDENTNTKCRIIIKLRCNNNYQTPAFRRLRAIMS